MNRIDENRRDGEKGESELRKRYRELFKRAGFTEEFDIIENVKNVKEKFDYIHGVDEQFMGRTTGKIINVDAKNTHLIFINESRFSPLAKAIEFRNFNQPFTDNCLVDYFFTYPYFRNKGLLYAPERFETKEERFGRITELTFDEFYKELKTFFISPVKPEDLVIKKLNLLLKEGYEFVYIKGKSINLKNLCVQNIEEGKVFNDLLNNK